MSSIIDRAVVKGSKVGSGAEKRMRGWWLLVTCGDLGGMAAPRTVRLRKGEQELCFNLEDVMVCNLSALL